MVKNFLRLLSILLWIYLGGFGVAALYFAGAVGMFVTIIGIPVAYKLLKLCLYSLWPFGWEVEECEAPYGCFFTLPFYILWWALFGLLLFALHIIIGFMFYVTIIGIPFGRKHLEMAKYALDPFETNVVKKRG